MFRPHWTTTVATVLALIILVNLGLWQTRRYFESRDQVTEVSARLSEGPALNEDVEAGADKLEWREARLEGRFLGVPTQYIAGHTAFGRPGYQVVQAFELTTGPVLLVNRGWIPMENYQEALANIPAGTEVHTEQGLLLGYEGEPDASPIPATDDAPERFARPTGCNPVSSPNYPAMAKRMGVEPLDVVLVAGERLERIEDQRREPLPIDGYVARPKHIPHREYAGQWFSIAVVLLLVWGYGGYRRARNLEG